jgi:hypothetical protein
LRARRWRTMFFRGCSGPYVHTYLLVSVRHRPGTLSPLPLFQLSEREVDTWVETHRRIRGCLVRVAHLLIRNLLTLPTVGTRLTLDESNHRSFVLPTHNARRSATTCSSGVVYVLHIFWKPFERPQRSSSYRSCYFKVLSVVESI